MRGGNGFPIEVPDQLDWHLLSDSFSLNFGIRNAILSTYASRKIFEGLSTELTTSLKRHCNIYRTQIEPVYNESSLNIEPCRK